MPKAKATARRPSRPRTPKSKRAREREKPNPLSFLVAEAKPTYKRASKKVAVGDEYFYDPNVGVKLIQGNCLDVLADAPDECVDMIFADPPYFLSNDGITCHAGKMVSVNKGKWDASKGVQANHEFAKAWLAECKRVLKPTGSIWVSGTLHAIYSIGFAMQELGYKILNDIIWEKSNPPPNLSCRYFTHSTEIVLWARKSEKARHHFDYQLMKKINGGKQMKNVWRMNAPKNGEKKYGKHPTQKPLELLRRIVLASTEPGALVLDPFMGSATTGVAAIELERKFVGIELEDEYLAVAMKRIKDGIKDRERGLPAEAMNG